MANKKVVVAFSGGLDTSYTVMKLTQDGWDVYAACANTGGFSAEQLKENLQALLAALTKAKPATAKGIFIKKVSLSTTMGAGVAIDQSSL